MARTAPHAGACIGMVLAGEVLGYGACVAAGVLPLSFVALGVLAGGALFAGGAGGFVLVRRARRAACDIQGLHDQAVLVPELNSQLDHRRAQQRQLRHDIRGALSPALLTADRLLANGEPGVKRSGEIVVRCVEKAIALLADAPPEPAAQTARAETQNAR